VPRVHNLLEVPGREWLHRGPGGGSANLAVSVSASRTTTRATATKSSTINHSRRPAFQDRNSSFFNLLNKSSTAPSIVTLSSLLPFWSSTGTDEPSWGLKGTAIAIIYRIMGKFLVRAFEMYLKSKLNVRNGDVL
jgi:hypothetical protein